MTNKIETFLSAVGKLFKEGLSKIVPIAQAAVPIIASLDPGAGAILSTTIGVVAEVEQKFAAMGKQSGTGPQKLADAVSILTPLLTTGLSEAGQAATAAKIEKYISDAVALLNDIPATAASPA